MTNMKKTIDKLFVEKHIKQLTEMTMNLNDIVDETNTTIQEAYEATQKCEQARDALEFLLNKLERS